MDATQHNADRPRLYRAFGLRIRSALDLPELAPAPDDGAPGEDVRIVLGSVCAVPGGAVQVDSATCVTHDGVWLETPAGRFQAVGGRLITVAPAPGVSQRDVRLYLLGTMIGAVLHQRAVLPLHANAIGLGDHAIAFAGPSGAGKSTLAAYFQSRGRAVLSDDVCALDLGGDGRLRAAPGLTRIKLWGETVAALGSAVLGRRVGDLDGVADGMAKFSLRLNHASPTPMPLKALYILDPGGSDVVSTVRLAGAQAVDGVLANIYRWPMAVAMGRAAAHFATTVTLVRDCEILLLRYPRGFDTLPAIVAYVDPQAVGALPDAPESL